MLKVDSLSLELACPSRIGLLRAKKILTIPLLIGSISLVKETETTVIEKQDGAETTGSS